MRVAAGLGVCTWGAVQAASTSKMIVNGKNLFISSFFPARVFRMHVISDGIAVCCLRHPDHKCNACDHIHHVAQNMDDDSNVDILLFYPKEQRQ